MKIVICLAALCLIVSPGWSQACSPTTTWGTYSLVCTGFVTPAPNGPQVPFTALGTVKITDTGIATGSAKVSIAGLILDQTVTGTATINSDCSGTVVYDQKLNGQPAGKLNIIYRAFSEGEEIIGMDIDAGTNMICTLKMFSRR